jgi:hypothetical protein
MKYTVSVFLIAIVLLASTRAAPVTLSDDALLDDDYLEDVVESVVPEVDVDLSEDPILDHDTYEHEYCTPWPECKKTNIASHGITHQHNTPTTCNICQELAGGVCQEKVCAPGKSCQLTDRKRSSFTIKAGRCG